jgi:pimeloyl-ACP methyl ester carboxylesterase
MDLVSGIQQLSLDLPSGRSALLRAGQGSRLLVLLHGFPDHPPNFDALIALLADAGYDVVAPWLRGYAPSTLAGPYHVDQVAQDVLELASALGQRRFVLVGHDWGALASYVLCALAPERIAAAVTLSIPHPGALLSPQQLPFSAYMPLLAGPLGAQIGAVHDFAFVDLLWRRWSPGLKLDASRRRALHDCLALSWPAPARYYRALFWPPGAALRSFGPGLRIRVPLLHLHGADDGCVLASSGAGQARFFSGPFASELRASAGHLLALEAPGWVAERTIAWFAEHAGDVSTMLPAPAADTRSSLCRPPE